MKNKIIFSFVWFAAACSAAPTPNKVTPRTGADSSVTTSGTATNNDSTTGLTAEQMLDPRKAKVTLLAQPAKVAASNDPQTSLEVPGFKMKIEGAHFVRMLRCAKDHKVSYHGKDLNSPWVTASGDLTRDMIRAAWDLSASDIGQTGCDLVGDHIVREDFIDLTAGNRTTVKQEFYYVINPCVRAEYSTFKGDNCSYNLTFTNPMEFSAKYEQAFLDFAKNVTDTEETLSSYFYRIKAIAYQMQTEAETCERKYLEEVEKRANRFGLAKIAGLAVGTLVGSLIGGGVTEFVGGQGLISNTITSVFSGNQEAPKYKCEPYEKLRAQGVAIEQKLPEVMDKLLNARKQLAAVNSAYAQLEVKVLGDNYNRNNKIGQ